MNSNNVSLIVIVVSLYRCRPIRLRCQPVKLPRMRCDSENNHNNHYQEGYELGTDFKTYEV